MLIFCKHLIEKISQILAFFFNRAMEVACDGCPAWRDPNKHASENKHAMGARRAELKGLKKCFLKEPARPRPNSNKHAS